MDNITDGGNASRGRSTSSTSGKLQEHSHTREVIFALPSLQLHLKTEHLQTARTPDVIGKLKTLNSSDCYCEQYCVTFTVVSYAVLCVFKVNRIIIQKIIYNV